MWAALGTGVDLDKAARFSQGQIPERDTQLSGVNTPSSREDGRFWQNSIVSVIEPLGMKKSRLVGPLRPGKLKGHHLASGPRMWLRRRGPRVLSTHTALSLPSSSPKLECLGWDLGIRVSAKLRASREQAGASAVKDSEPSVVAVRVPALMALAKQLLCARPCARHWNLKEPD